MNIIPFEKSFASHERAKYWSSKNTGSATDYALNSHKKCWFDCECGHTFESTLLNINKGNNWCGYCSNPPKLLCSNVCVLCENKSFASHSKSICWSDENEIDPRHVFKNADRKKYKFVCNICFHNFEMNLKCITMKNQFCPYCAHQKLCNNLECKICYNNSFASIERSKFLNDKIINPRMLFKSTNKKYKFDCDKCNYIFETQLSSITNGIWCPNCVNKTEEKLFNELIKLYVIKRQFKTNWCKNPKTNKYLPYDFIIEDLNIIIEQDGPQHFKQIGNWQSPELTNLNDIYKMKCANHNGYSVIRLLQKDIWHNRYDWLQELTNNIDKIISEKKVQNIYMCKNDEYKDFDKELI
jgi:very-short-patch-repair endonuclease